MSKQPYIGAMVLFNVPGTGPSPAVITGLRADGLINLTVFAGEHDNLFVVSGVPYDQELALHCWAWNEDKPAIWAIERTDRYWFRTSRNGLRWVETTYWYNPETLERKEVSRTYDSYDFNDYKKPEWAKGVTEQRSSLNYE